MAGWQERALPDNVSGWYIITDGNQKQADETIKAIDAYWTAEVGGMKVRAYEEEECGNIKIIYGKGKYQQFSRHNGDVQGEKYQDGDILRAILTTAGVKIMPYSLSHGEYKPPKE
jgi:hypothetical protein